MIRDVVIDKNDNQSDEDNAIDATTPEQRNCQQGGAVTAGHDELIVDREGQECGDERISTRSVIVINPPDKKTGPKGPGSVQQSYSPSRPQA